MTRSLNRRLAGTILAGAAVCALAASAPMLGPEHAEHAAPPKIGEKAPNFTLTDLDGKKHDLKTYLEDGKTIVLEWFNPGCPFVKYAHGDGPLADMATRHAKNDVVWLAINSGAPVRAVLEIPGGRAAVLGIAPGDLVRHAIFANAP